MLNLADLRRSQHMCTQHTYTCNTNAHTHTHTHTQKKASDYYTISKVKCVARLKSTKHSVHNALLSVHNIHTHHPMPIFTQKG